MFSLNLTQRGYIDKIIYLSSDSTEKSKELLRLHLEMLITILSDATSKLEFFKSGLSSAATYSKIFSYLQENYDKKLSPMKIAGDNNLSVSNLKNIVFKYSGVGVIKLFNAVKIMTAENKFGEISKKEATQMLGFKSPGYYSKLVKKLKPE